MSAPRLSARHRKGLKAKLKRIDASALARLNEMATAARELGDRPRRLLVRADLVSLEEARRDPVLAIPVYEALLAAFATAHGLGSGSMVECFTCLGGWSNARRPGSIAVIKTSQPAGMVLSLVCDECCDRPQGQQVKALGAAVRRDFFSGEGEELTAASWAPEAGHT